MKNLKLGVSVLALSLASTAFSQTTTNKWLIGVGAHAENHMAAQGGITKTYSRLSGSELWNINNYTITPPLSHLTVARNIGRGLVIDWQTNVGNVDNKRFGYDKQFYFKTGLGLQFKLNSLWNEDSWLDPYFRVGGAYLRHDLKGLTFPRTDALGTQYDAYNQGNDPEREGRLHHFIASGGIGSNFWLTRNFGLGIQGDYNLTPTDGSSDVANHWQAVAQILFRFGNSDRDKDGILDKDDKCPDTPGLAQFQGCPDTDGDGIADQDDKCPTVAGPVENMGCPWPDTDGDGIVDREDQCPNVPGPRENMGCPWKDTDNDGILDKDDKCPTVPGLAQYQGCPKPQEAFAQEAEIALRDLLFHFNSDRIIDSSLPKIDEAAKVIEASNGGTFLLVGHTDRKGSEQYNLNLSRKRAAAVVRVLEARGINPSQLKSKGVGMQDATVPASASDAERLQDRKVQVKYVTGADWDSLQKSDVVEVQRAIQRGKLNKIGKKKRVIRRK